MSQPIRVLIVDDHAMVREGLRTMLRQQESLEIVGEAATVAEAIERIEKLKPQVVLLDIRLPDVNGLEGCKLIHERFPEVYVIILTVYEDEHYLFEALRAGARGYMLKKVTDDELARCVEAVFKGEVMVDPSLAGRLARRTALAGTKEAELAPRMTPREREILAAIAEGWSNQKIAETLHISEETVKSHVKSIYRKLGVQDRAQAVSLALRAGILH